MATKIACGAEPDQTAALYTALGGTVLDLTDTVVAEHVAWMRLRRLSEDTIRLRLTALNSVTGVCRKPMIACTPDDLDRWQRALHVTDTSRVTYVNQVRAFYAWTVAVGRLDRDPSTGLIRPRLARRQPRPISEQDLAMALLTAPTRVKPILELAAYAGFRAGEVSRLTREDIHDELAAPLLVVRGKGRKERVVPMAARIWDALVEFGLPLTGWVFGRLDGEPGPMPPMRVSRVASDHLRSVGIDATLHQLRHRFLTEIYRQTKDIRLTQELAGHSSPTTTAGYAAWSPDAAAVAVAALARKTA